MEENSENNFDQLAEDEAFEELAKRLQATKPTDMVNQPPHYTSDPSGVECIQITRHRNFNIGNAIKYLWRAGLKDSNKEIQDLEKAVWYIQDEIKRLKHCTEGKGK